MAWVSGMVVCGHAGCAHTCILTDGCVKSRYVAIYRCHVAMLNYLGYNVVQASHCCSRSSPRSTMVWCIVPYRLGQVIAVCSCWI